MSMKTIKRVDLKERPRKNGLAFENLLYKLRKM